MFYQSLLRQFVRGLWRETIHDGRACPFLPNILQSYPAAGEYRGLGHPIFMYAAMETLASLLRSMERSRQLRSKSIIST